LARGLQAGSRATSTAGVPRCRVQRPTSTPRFPSRPRSGNKLPRRHQKPTRSHSKRCSTPRPPQLIRRRRRHLRHKPRPSRPPQHQAPRGRRGGPTRQPRPTRPRLRIRPQPPPRARPRLQQPRLRIRPRLQRPAAPPTQPQRAAIALTRRLGAVAPTVPRGSLRTIRRRTWQARSVPSPKHHAATM